MKDYSTLKQIALTVQCYCVLNKKIKGIFKYLSANQFIISLMAHSRSKSRWKTCPLENSAYVSLNDQWSHRIPHLFFI